MFSRRGSADAQSEKKSSDGKSAATAPADSRPQGGPGKGRPTPKRKEAEQARREAAKPTIGRAARKQSAKERAALRAERLEAIKRGDERYLPERDKGPVRALARDVVDSRLSAAEFFLPLAVLMLLTSFAGRAAAAMATSIWMLMMLFIFVDLVVINRRVKKAAAARFPKEPARGVGLYAVMRALTWRKMRTPAPRVDRGAKV